MRKQNYRYWLNLSAFALLAVGLGAIAVLAFIAYRSTQSYLHPARSHRGADDNPGKYGVAYQPVHLTTRDGLELAAWYTPPENGALILVAHGHADSKSPRPYVLFARHGYGVLAWDFRAHGESGGELSTIGYDEALDVEAALEYALRQAKVEHIGAWGSSMGGAAVLEAAARRDEIEAVVADSAFTSAEEVLKWIVTDDIFLPFIRIFVGMETGLAMDRLRPVDRIRELSPRAVMIVHGEADSVIPVGAAQRLYAAAGEPCILWTEAGVDHAGMLSAYPEEYEQRVVGFFDEYLLGEMR